MCEVLRLHARTNRSTMCSASSSTMRLQQTDDQRVAVSERTQQTGIQLR